jgi:hypothetical protein
MLGSSIAEELVIQLAPLKIPGEHFCIREKERRGREAEM